MEKRGVENLRPESMNGVSIILCCYNSAKRLPQTLEHLAAQKVDASLPLEVILVDNASTDNTVEVASKLWNGHRVHIPFKIVGEGKAGLSHARKKGIQEASYDVVIFCDDDNWLQPDYARIASRIMTENTRIGVMGGMGVPEFENDPPPWFKEMSKSYAVGPQGTGSGVVENGGIVYGAGMVVRKQVLTDLFAEGVTSILSDRKGNDLVSGGDNEICFWYIFLGYQVYYCEDLQFRHFIPAARMTENYIVKRSYGKGKTEAILRVYGELLKGRLEIDWLDNRVLWVAEIIKRVFFWMRLALKPSKNLEERLQMPMIKSSVLYRLRNYRHLRQCEQQVRAAFPVNPSVRK
jgi:glycosyltransferase involved in cell wall biosynthesis